MPIKTIVPLHDPYPDQKQLCGWPEVLSNSLGSRYRLRENDSEDRLDSNEATYQRTDTASPNGKRIVTKLRGGSFVIEA